VSDYDISEIERSIQEPDDPMPRYEETCSNCGRPLDDPDAPGEPCEVCGAGTPGLWANLHERLAGTRGVHELAELQRRLERQR
jgi:hypothetical protein